MLNKVILIGNLGADPENRAMPNGGQITNVRLATTRKWKDKSGERKEETEWHRVVLMGKLGEIAREYLRKGSQIYVEGRIRTQKWQDKSGQDRYTTEIIAQEMLMIGGKDKTAATGNYGGKSTQGSSSAPSANDHYPDDFDDDIPF